MGQTQRRPGFLRWGESARAEDADASAEPAESPTDETTAAEDVAEQPAEQSPLAAPSAGEASPDANPFLRDLVGAMRGVAESSRDTNLAELRQSVEQRVEELKAAAAERAEELRRRSELDLGGIGDWERGELERVRAEAEQRRKTRRELLEKELADHQANADGQMDATRGRLAEYERELEAFFDQLSKIEDPAAFVAAAKRMPAPPELSAPGSAKAAPASETASVPPGTGSDALAERLAQLDERLGTTASQPSEPQPEAEAAPDAGPAPAAAPAAVQPAGTGTATATVAAPAAAPAVNGTTAEVSTPIVVKGLGSFGAITSFKQALERVDGVRGVTLSLGPTGDFVYRASHAAEFDVVGAIRSIEGPNVDIEEADGQLRVTIERPR
jgi:hypothetical protein